MVLTLSLLSNVYTFDAFTKLEEEIGFHEISLTENILRENIAAEKSVFPFDKEINCHMLCVTFDSA